MALKRRRDFDNREKNLAPRMADGNASNRTPFVFDDLQLHGIEILIESDPQARPRAGVPMLDCRRTSTT
ncbi:MAG TPA: hypothetical protein VMR62_00065 [Bryobacteraceae bacterium]|jgi:hypothetical protein|nr:hypothetical protein [Bryobacteraceae bacterium]